MTATATLTRNIVLVACAASAGVHAGLVPSHLAEAPPLGLAFASAALLLVAVTVALARVGRSRWPDALAAGMLAGLIAAYAASRTVGLPLLEEDAEPVDATGLLTQAVQAIGLIAAVRLCQPASGAMSPAVRKERS